MSRRVFTAAPVLLLLICCPMSWAEPQVGPATQPDGASVEPRVIARLRGHGGAWIRFSPDGSLLLTACDKDVQIWDARTYAPMGQPVAYPGGLVTAGFAASGRMAYVAHSKGVELWNARTGERVGSGVNAHFPVYAAAVSPDGTRAVINSVIPPSPMPERALHLFDTRTGREIPQLPHIDWAVFAAFSPDGRRLLSMERVGMHFARFHVWDLASGRDLFPPIRTSSSLNCPPGFGTAPGVFSPDGHRVALVGSRRFAVFDTESGTRLAGKGPPYDDEDSSADGLAFSADGKWIVCIDNRLGTSLCDAATAKPRADMAYVPDAIYSFSISADATRIACSYRVGRGVNDVVTATGIFDLLTGKLLHRLGDAEDGIPALSPSGDRLAVTGTGTRKDETTVWRLLEAK